MLIGPDIIDLVGLSEKAVKILEHPDRKLQFQLRKHTPAGEIIDCFVVYHSTAMGPPCKGGVRISSDVTMEETTRLAEIMTYKSSLMKLPFGGGKSGIKAESNLSPELKSDLMQGFTHEIREELKTGAYVPAPDMGTGPREMAEIFDETHKQTTVTGKPIGIGGLPGREEATGYGVSKATKLAIRNILETKESDLTIAIQGFGNVGSWTAKFLAEEGAIIETVSTEEGAIYEEDGLDIEKLFDLKKKYGDKCVKKYENGESIELGKELIRDVDILIPAAMGGTITPDVAEKIKADLIVEGANDPTAAKADKILDEKEIPVVPDFLANAGGVIASYVEWRGGKSGSKTKREETYRTIKSGILDAFEEVLKISEEEEIRLRKAALVSATKTIRETMEGRGWI